MPSLLFVHGIGVREDGYPDVLPAFTAGIGKIRPGLRVDWCFWGAEHGASLRADGSSIPRRRSAAKDDAQRLAAERGIRQWALLEEDLTLELRISRRPRPRRRGASTPFPSVRCWRDGPTIRGSRPPWSTRASTRASRVPSGGARQRRAEEGRT